MNNKFLLVLGSALFICSCVPHSQTEVTENNILIITDSSVSRQEVVDYLLSLKNQTDFRYMYHEYEVQDINMQYNKFAYARLLNFINLINKRFSNLEDDSAFLNEFTEYDKLLLERKLINNYLVSSIDAIDDWIIHKINEKYGDHVYIKVNEYIIYKNLPYALIRKYRLNG